jgi:adenylate cyclase
MKGDAGKATPAVPERAGGGTDGEQPLDVVALDRELLGGDRRYNRQEIAEQAGVPVEQAEQLWRALGFPAPGPDEKAFTDRDAEALCRVRKLTEDGWLDEDTALAMTRAVGQSMSRLAEWQISTLTSSDVDSAGPEWAVARAANLVPEVEELMTYVWRRHLAAVGARSLNSDPDQMSVRQLTVGFVDLVNYTSLTRQLGEAELARLIETFDGIASDTVAELGGRVVKTVGDEVLFVADGPAAGANIGLGISEQIAAHDDLPDTRTGLACGTVLSRLGDVYGEPVNIAARLTAIARPGSVLVDRELAEALGDDPAFRLRRMAPRPVRGYAMLQPFRLRRADPASD